MSKSVKDIVKSFKNSDEPSSVEAKKDQAVEKKKIVIKDVLGDMKETIHQYHNKRDEIDKGTDEKGRNF